MLTQNCYSLCHQSAVLDYAGVSRLALHFKNSVFCVQVAYLTYGVPLRSSLPQIRFLDYAGLHVLFFITKKQSFFSIQINSAADEFRATHSLYRKSAIFDLLCAQSPSPVALRACRLRLFAYRITLRSIRPQIRSLGFLPRSWSSNFVPTALPLSSIRYPACSRTEIRLLLDFVSPEFR